MTYMEEVFGNNWADKFATAEEQGRITIREHKEFPTLQIANYTPATAYEGAWDEITKASRGLIFDVETGEILARPFEKFFNFGQTGAPVIDLDAPLYGVGDKYDGSLGIGYVRPDGKFAIATRGSFHSEQANHANALIESGEGIGYPYTWFAEDVHAGVTPLFEIIYPENRIVLDYEQQDYLQPIGWIRRDSGAYIGMSENEGFEAGGTFREVLSRKPRPNAEGYVVWIDQHTAVKIKQEDYVALHKIVTGLSEKVVWREIQKGPVEFRKFVASLPDELQQWADDIGLSLALLFGKIVAELDKYYLIAVDVAWVRSEASEGTIPRKDLAQAVKDVVPQEYWGYMFSIADGKDYQDKIWRIIEPKGQGSRPSSTMRALEEA